MNDCMNAEMRDSLPDLVHGNLERARLAQVEAHIATCDACAQEVELLRTVVASMPATPRMDVQRIVAALPVATKKGLLLHRGNAETAAPAPARKRSRGVWSSPVLRVAAAALVVAAGGLSLFVGRDVLNPETQVGQSTRPVAATSAPETTKFPEIEGTPAVTRVAESTSVATVAVGAGSGLLMSEVQELSDEHLVALLGEIESIDPLPAAEPETIVPAVAESDSGATQ